MNAKKNSSLLVILISASQLIVMLVIIGVMYQYSRSQLTEQTKSKLFEANVQLIDHCQSQLESLSGRSVAHDQRLRDEVLHQLSQVHRPGDRFFVLMDARTCEVYGEHEFDSEKLGSRLVASADDDRQPLSQFVSQNGMIRSGELELGSRNYYFTGKWLKNIDGYLMVFENSGSIQAHVGSIVEPVKKTAFGLFLLVGLIGICISVLVLQRYDSHLNEVNQSLEDMVVARTDDLLTTQKAVIYGLAKLAESRDNDTGDHLARIQLYVTILARALMKYHDEIDEEYIQNLSLASSLHDIGKVGVPDAILLKQGRLTPAERSIMELHTLIGGDCLSSIQSQLGENDFLEMARQIAYFHHERWDGTGYPKKRREEDIPLCARIVSVADVYDALRTKRPYKQPLPHQKSREIILSGIGTQFDPEVVSAFLENEAEFERISEECSRMTEEEVTPKIKMLSEMIATG